MHDCCAQLGFYAQDFCLENGVALSELSLLTLVKVIQTVLHRQSVLTETPGCVRLAVKTDSICAFVSALSHGAWFFGGGEGSQCKPSWLGTHCSAGWL